MEATGGDRRRWRKWQEIGAVVGNNPPPLPHSFSAFPFSHHLPHQRMVRTEEIKLIGEDRKPCSIRHILLHDLSAKRNLHNLTARKIYMHRQFFFVHELHFSQPQSTSNLTSVYAVTFFTVKESTIFLSE